MHPTVVQTAPTPVSSRPRATHPASTRTQRKPQHEPDVKLATTGTPDVTRVVHAFRPLLERLLERVRGERDVIPLTSRPAASVVR